MDPTLSVEDFIPLVARQRAEDLRKENADPRRRVLIIGIPGSGKTYSACTTFPGVIALDYDNQLDDEAVRSKIVAHYPMYDEELIAKKFGVIGTPLDRFTKIVTQLAPKLTPKFTIFIDSMSTFADALKTNLEARVPKGKEGNNDTYWFWREWSKSWRELCTTIKNLNCNVVMSAHEAEVRDETTNRLEKFGWILQGREFTPRIPQFFTDVLRMCHTVTVDKSGILSGEKWEWQIKPTIECPHLKSRCKQNKLMIPARWDELIK